MNQFAASLPRRGLELLLVLAVITSLEATLGAMAAEPMKAALSQNTSSWPYPQPPWEWHVDTMWGFIGTHPINGSHPPDDVPDPAITYVSQPFPSAFSIFRYKHAYWGDWDQVIIIASGAKIGNGPAAGRATQAFSSAAAPTLPSNPLHIPHRLARFEWTHRSDGATDLKLYSPPSSASPILSIWGLSKVPFVSYPVAPNTFNAVGLNSQSMQSVVDSYDPLGPITGHVLNEYGYEGTGGIALYSRYETSDGLDLDGGFFNVGISIDDAKFVATTAPYPSS